ncbi:MAG: glycosyltransferase family 39 protein [Rhodanobacteraceae bacterium]
MAPSTAPISEIAASARRTWRELALFMLFAFVLIGAGIGLRDPWPADEPRFALVAKQMVDSGDWLIPHRGSELYSDKPPTFMAMQALAYVLTRNWRIAFLLPSLIFSLGTLWLVYDLARRLWNHRVGLYGAGALLFTVQFLFQAKAAQIDPTVTFFITLANYGLLRHFLLGPCWRWYWLGCFAAGLGVITKGVGIVAGLMFVPYVFARRRGWEHLAPIENNPWRWVAGIVWFMFALSLWLVPMLIKVHEVGTPRYLAYAHDILFHQTAGRYTGSWDHHQPVWFYLVVVLTGWLPLSLTYPFTISAWRERLAARDARFLLTLGWVVLMIAFFSIPSGKRDVYIMPALPIMALVSAPFLQEALQRRWLKRAALALIALFGTIFLAGGVYALFVHPPRALEFAAQHGLSRDGDALWLLSIAIGSAALIPAIVFRARCGVHALLFGLSGMWMLWSFCAYPLLNDSTSAAAVMRRTREIIGADGQLAMVAWREQDLFLADRPVTEFGLNAPWHEQLSQAIRWQQGVPQDRWIFILADAMKPCIATDRSRYLGVANRRHWWLFRTDAVAQACRGGRVPVIAGEGPDRNNPE